MVTNKLNIGSKIKVDFGKDSKVVGNGEVGTVISMWADTKNNEIYYTADLDNGFEKKPCCEGGLPINSIQFREGQYKLIK